MAEAILQSLGKFRPPVQHKNWPAICEALRPEYVGPEDARPCDPAVVWANALANPQSEYGRRLAAVFPEFWSDAEVQGPIPWSMLKEQAARGNSRDVSGLDPNDPEDHNRLYDICLGLGYSLPFPTVSFACPGTDSWGNYIFPPLPQDFKGEKKVGDMVTWRGSNWIVIQNNERGYGEISITPAKCIAMDL